jgi:chymotrypsin
VYLGVIDSNNGPAQYGTNVTSKSDVKVHAGYNPDTLLNDIAMIRMKDAPTNLFTNAYIKNITLPVNQAGTNLVGMSSIVSGFGRTSDASQAHSQWLKYVSLTVAATTACNVYGADFVRSSLICVYTTTLSSSCSGDSGLKFGICVVVKIG